MMTGSLFALWKLGPEVVDLLILPSIPTLHHRISASPQTMHLVNDILRDHFKRMCANAISTAIDQQGGAGIAKNEVRNEQIEVWRGAYGGFADAVFSADLEDDIEMGQ